uniref:protein acetyllysine N-acetyltransferase n=1 Tax=Hirondellea gigas TaxID=1518452 RepID=A0A6A7G071_9CRUS
MSCNYAEGLSPYPDKGQLGMPERVAGKEEVSQKVAELAAMMKASRHTVFHTGAGISTSAGIPDFRGPKGVWTLEKKGLKPDVNVSFDDALPTYTHMALVALEKAGLIQYLVTQNIDGLHLRSGFPRRKMAELHGNMYLDKCSVCRREFVRDTAVSTVGQKTLGVGCRGKRETGRRCRGRMHDNILDWEHDLPHLDYNLAEKHSTGSELSVCLGTTLQIIPSGVLPTIAKQSGGKLVICNLQPTKHDKISDLIINAYVDDVMRELMSLLNICCLEYSLEQDPVLITRALCNSLSDESEAEPIEWTIPEAWFDDPDLTEKMRRNKQIVEAKNATRKSGRTQKIDRKKRRSLIKDDSSESSSKAASIKNASARGKRCQGRKRSTDDISGGDNEKEEMRKQPKVDDADNKLQDLDKVKKEDNQMDVDETSSNNTDNLSNSAEVKIETKTSTVGDVSKSTISEMGDKEEIRSYDKIGTDESTIANQNTSNKHNAIIDISKSNSIVEPEKQIKSSNIPSCSNISPIDESIGKCSSSSKEDCLDQTLEQIALVSTENISTSFIRSDEPNTATTSTVSVDQHSKSQELLESARNTTLSVISQTAGLPQKSITNVPQTESDDYHAISQLESATFSKEKEVSNETESSCTSQSSQQNIDVLASTICTQANVNSNTDVTASKVTEQNIPPAAESVKQTETSTDYNDTVAAAQQKCIPRQINKTSNSTTQIHTENVVNAADSLQTNSTERAVVGPPASDALIGEQTQSDSSSASETNRVSVITEQSKAS